MVGYGLERFGKAGKARHSLERFVKVCLGEARQAGPGKVSNGGVWQC